MYLLMFTLMAPSVVGASDAAKPTPTGERNRGPQGEGGAVLAGFDAPSRRHRK